MHEIKFRAWSAEDFTMVPIDFKGGDDATRDFDYRALSGDVSLPIMQYVGLNDKDGVEIYEGDIVKAKNLESLGEIKWEKNTCSFCFVSTFDGRWVRKMFWLHGWESHLEWKVVGNVYENPELLK